MIKHLSISSYNHFMNCGESWRRRYIEEEIIPPGIAARIGTGVHEAAEINYSQKISSGIDMPISDIQDAAATAYDRAVQDGVYFASDEEKPHNIIVAEGKDSTVTLASLYAEKLAPAIQPAFAEKRIEFYLPDIEIPIVAIIDLYTKNNELRDLKTSSKSWSQVKADTNPQLLLYREAINIETGAYPEDMCFDVLVNLKKPKHQKLVPLYRDGIEVLTLKFKAMLDAIKAGTFLPAQPSSWVCSPKWCGYWHTCKYVSPFEKNAKSSNQICTFEL